MGALLWTVLSGSVLPTEEELGSHNTGIIYHSLGISAATIGYLSESETKCLDCGIKFKQERKKGILVNRVGGRLNLRCPPCWKENRRRAFRKYHQTHREARLAIFRDYYRRTHP